MIVFQGKSRFDGEAYSVVATGLDRPSANQKTGKMIQLTILPTDQSPVSSIATAKSAGAPHTVCGDCPLSGRGCYVDVSKSTTSIWKKLGRGGYKALDLTRFIGRAIRFGAWGEPTLIPIRLVRNLTKAASNWTGYTHQWSKPFARFYRPFLMASVQSSEGKAAANAQGWRTFRIIRSESELQPDEVLCPATQKRARPVQCITCGLCRGTSLKAKNVAVVVHGGVANLRSALQVIDG